jgi:hypothetical protein
MVNYIIIFRSYGAQICSVDIITVKKMIFYLRIFVNYFCV